MLYTKSENSNSIRGALDATLMQTCIRSELAVEAVGRCAEADIR